jgi:hypothetical protein
VSQRIFVMKEKTVMFMKKYIQSPVKWKMIDAITVSKLFADCECKGLFHDICS